MENEILENGSAPEEEKVLQPEETVEVAEEIIPEEMEEAAEDTVAEEATPAEEKKSIGDIVSNAKDKGKELYNNRGAILGKIKALSQKAWIMIGGGVAALIAIILVLGLLGNTYKSPIKATEKLLSSKSFNQVIKRAPAVLNGFGESEAKTLIRIVKKTDAYKENKEDIEDGFDKLIDMLEDNAGKNYKIQLKVVDKDELERDDIKAFRDQLRNIGDQGKTLEDLDKDDIEDMADETGLSKAKVKKIIKVAKGFCKDCDKAKVKKGYALTVEVKVTGRKLDEPLEMEIPVNVFKVDGRWVIDVFTLADDAMNLVMGGMMGGMMGGIGGLGGMSGLLGGF